MAKSIENCDEISFNEFRAWMIGLIRGKRGELPDIEDWKQIKTMMDKVKDGKGPMDFPQSPYRSTILGDPTPLQPEEQPWYNPYKIWCNATSTAGINFGNLDIEIPALSDPALGNIEDLSTISKEAINELRATRDKKKW